MESPFITPEIQEKYSILQTEYIRLLSSKEVLEKWGKPQLEALYTVKLGNFQLERLQLQLTIKGLKRKIELVHAAVNQGISIDFATIELNVAAELAQTELLIMNQAEQITQARHLLSHLDSPERSAELRQLYKKLAKQLHPDVNPELTVEQQEIWHKVRDAYEVGDLERLKALQVIYEKEISQAGAQTQSLTDEELQLRLEVLREGIKVLEADIQKIRSVFPFIIEAQIKDEEWVKAQVAEIQAEMDKLKEYEAQLCEEYHQLLQFYGS